MPKTGAPVRPAPEIAQCAVLAAVLRRAVQCRAEQFLQIFAIFWRARSRLYQIEILQENMRLRAFFKLYNMCTLLHRSKFNILAKNRLKKSAIFAKFQQQIFNFMKSAEVCQFFILKIQLDKLIL